VGSPTLARFVGLYEVSQDDDGGLPGGPCAAGARA
jgi:hypothetical protein